MYVFLFRKGEISIIKILPYCLTLSNLDSGLIFYFDTGSIFNLDTGLIFNPDPGSIFNPDTALIFNLAIT